ncbi:glycosyltransferase family 4 protein [Corynebacterium aurimucosum]|uniref:Glycosyltransferase family 4 protein n=1 Tax=Corynebacterium aurimucosum TaxID=169292 RepID=A0A558GJN3_9CORY|nr:glycosyltransferase family 4 protein [Corynebacterium aurimucosum]
MNILSIRPFASYKYANDQTVEAIKILSTRPYFDDLNFTIVGEGRLFSELTLPLKKFKNVKLRKRFLNQEEISKLHAENGIFMAPTRFDSQGVSMCEAMSSGLVPISSKIAAIPEFVRDGETGLLVEPESPRDLADAVEELYFDSELFSRLSAAAASSIGNLCGRSATTDRELELIAEKVEN